MNASSEANDRADKLDSCAHIPTPPPNNGIDFEIFI